MGRRKFRFSDMMPNSWFYKLRVMRRAGGGSGAGGASVMHHSSSSQGAKGSTQPARTPRPMPVPIPHRTSYYYASRDRVPQPAPAPQPTRAAAAENHHQLVPQTQSSSRSYRRRHRVGPVEKAAPPVAETPPDAHHHRRRDTCVGRDGVGDVGKQPLKPAMKEPSSKNIVTGKVIASDTGIMFDLHAEDMPERVLRPIVTKPVRVEAGRYETKERHVVHHTAVTPRASSASEQGSKGNSRRSSVSSGRRRLKTRTNSPRLASRCRKSRSTNPATTPAASSPQKTTPPPPLAESFAVVKASVDPRKDFRESMEEMIAEKGIRDAGDLEDLLACYLALNAGEHHDLIVEVFEEIWASLASVNP